MGYEVIPATGLVLVFLVVMFFESTVFKLWRIRRLDRKTQERAALTYDWATAPWHRCKAEKEFRYDDPESYGRCDLRTQHSGMHALFRRSGITHWSTESVAR